MHEIKQHFDAFRLSMSKKEGEEENNSVPKGFEKFFKKKGDEKTETQKKGEEKTQEKTAKKE